MMDGPMIPMILIFAILLFVIILDVRGTLTGEAVTTEEIFSQRPIFGAGAGFIGFYLISERFGWELLVFMFAGVAVGALVLQRFGHVRPARSLMAYMAAYFFLLVAFNLLDKLGLCPPVVPFC